MRILVLNSGSSSLKYRLISFGGGENVVGTGTISIGGRSASAAEVETHAEAFAVALRKMRAEQNERVDAVAHRVVHGGTLLEAKVIDERVESIIAANAVLAPSHNPAALVGIHAAREYFPEAVQVAVFDTAFHAGLPTIAASYPLPRDLSIGGLAIRRYGFHGISCAWCLRQAAEHLGKPPAQLNLIVAHLGAGASITAIRDGRSADTSMGMTPLEGLMMQRRSGDLDPAIVIQLARAGHSLDEIEVLLNRQSGVFAIAGEDEMAKVAGRARAGDEDAILARAMYAYRVQKYMGAYAGAVWPLDAIVFTGGVGENDGEIRSEICRGLPQLGVELDEKANQAEPGRAPRRIGGGRGVAILVIPANEELQIARETARLLRPGSDG
jgi:acetate kinase